VPSQVRLSIVGNEVECAPLQQRGTQVVDLNIVSIWVVIPISHSTALAALRDQLLKKPDFVPYERLWVRSRLWFARGAIL
jgi:hypothetical protein